MGRVSLCAKDTLNDHPNTFDHSSRSSDLGPKSGSNPYETTLLCLGATKVSVLELKRRGIGLYVCARVPAWVRWGGRGGGGGGGETNRDAKKTASPKFSTSPNPLWRDGGEARTRSRTHFNPLLSFFFLPPKCVVWFNGIFQVHFVADVLLWHIWTTIFIAKI